MKRPLIVFVGFVVLLTLWTWKLLEPNPIPPVVRDLISWSDWLVFLLAKGLHAGVYAMLVVLGRLAFTSPRWRLGVVLFLLVHGIGTEIGQTFVPNRYGSVKDVVIDTTGVLVGWLFSVKVLKS